MNKIAVTGGKGGTGKSTIAALKALKYAKQNKKVILVDCDVECPNDYLILGKKIGKIKKKVYTQYPKIDENKCTACGECVTACQENALFQLPQKAPILAKELCSGCGACALVCKTNAIDFEKEVVGKIYKNKIKKNLYLITGTAKPVTEETSPVVHATRRYASKLAKKIKADYLIIDTAAGTHCPVIAALINIDKAIIVTEPTPMGNHDLKLILDLVKKLKIKSEIIINQYNLGNSQKTLKLARKRNIKIAKKIPHKKEIAQAYSRGEIYKLNIL